ncbi:MAG: aminopeptidase N [Magnetococcales bacterium]|nr:aminopeptidase N [Magnetococcales bacterium]
MTDTPHTIHRLADYQPPLFLVDTVQMVIQLEEDHTLVESTLALRYHPDQSWPDGGVALCLDGRELELLQIRCDGRLLAADEYRCDSERLVLPRVTDPALVLTTISRIRPQDNQALEGLYRSNGLFCTQCEPEGFRRITWYPDRPDVMARFTVTIVAHRNRYPVLLANGNRIDHGPWPARAGYHFVTWNDPFPKPSYLFAMVAGQLACCRDWFVTVSGRTVALELYTDPGRETRGYHAIDALKKAMSWDEQRFGREYDLDLYMIVAVDDFNAGAMENKGLNIFNSQCVLADPDTATDDDYAAIESIIAHEYFHNWTGNRITCRDWFQLSLKEGLTVFRDQLFSAEMVSPSVQRIRTVLQLRSRQFQEDSGPTAHAVQPDSYIEINNFYTATVYEKGAEVVRMLHCLLGQERFSRGITGYFSRYDGQAVTVEDFVAVMEQESGGYDLQQFRLWYRQAGTPTLTMERHYDDATGCLTITLHQRSPTTPDQPVKQPLHIPLTVALLERSSGRRVPMQPDGATERVLELRQQRQQFCFHGVPSDAIPSLPRGFSAPVRLHAENYSRQEQAFLWACDEDPFMRWDAGQQLALNTILERAMALQRGEPWPSTADPLLLSAFVSTIPNQDLHPALKVLALTLPSETLLLDVMRPADPDLIHTARQQTLQQLVGSLATELAQAWQDTLVPASYHYDPITAGRRGWRHFCLDLLVRFGDSHWRTMALQQLYRADNMTDRWSAMVALVHSGSEEGNEALEWFVHRYQEDALVMNKWFRVQATAPLPQTLQRVERLLHHERFCRTNPNHIRALLGGFCHANPYCFHVASGAGYQLIMEQILRLDTVNPQVAARLLTSFSNWRIFESNRQRQMQQQLERVLQQPHGSAALFEIASKSLAGG